MKLLADEEARRRIREGLDATLVVEAAAGTGKTTMLVARILALVVEGRAELAKIVAVTFTEKAAGEMKLRLRAEVEAARQRPTTTLPQRARLDKALAQLEEAHIGTIHGFCADLLRERPIEAAVDPMFEMAPDDERERIFSEAFDAWFQKELMAPHEGVRRVLRRRSRDRDAIGPREALRRSGLDLVDQRDFDARWERVPIDRKAEIDGILAALRELGALAKECQYAEDWLEKNLAEVARFVEELDRRERIHGRDYDGLEALLRDLAKKKRGWTWKGGGKMYGRTLARADVLAQRDAVKAHLDRVLAAVDADLAACLREELRPLVAQYEELKGRAGKLDFLDLLVRARDLVKGDRAVRAALQARFTHLLVDEFQDTDPLQAEILLLLAADDPKEDDHTEVRVVPGKLFVVGDPKQSIYRFRRADVALYERTKARLVEQGAELLHLTTSFRSAPSLQRVVNEAFSRVMQGGANGSQAAYVPLEPFRDDPIGRPTFVALPVPRPYSDYGKIVAWRIDESLADAVGAFVDWLIKKSGWTVTERERPDDRVPIEARHVCLLFKRFASSGDDKTRPYVRALEARGVPHVLMGGRSYHTREEVIALRNALSAIEWPEDELSVFGTLRGPFFALGDEALLAYRQDVGSLHLLRPDKPDLAGGLREVAEAVGLLRELHMNRNRRPIADTIARLLDATRAHAGIAIWPTGEQALANILRVLDLARRFEAQGATSFRAFVHRMQDDAERGGAPEAPVVEEGTDGVRIMTVHRAKGLEFPVVVLVDPCAPPTMREPSRYTDPARRLCAMPLAGCSPRELALHKEEVLARDEDEAVRLTYVAATRARELLVVPACGDEPIDGWLDVLRPVVYPDARDWRSPRPAPGCAPFHGHDTVLERPPKVQHGSEDAVAPGLHASREGALPIVWWDPSALELGKEHDSGLRQQKLLEADAKGTATEEGIRSHDAWKVHRESLLGRGAEPSLRVRTATEIASAPPRTQAAVTHVEVSGRRADRPHHKRFGTLVHAVLAEAPLDARVAEVAKVAAKQARLVGAPDEEAQAAAQAVSAALAHPLLVRAAASAKRGECRREVGVSIGGADDLVEGVVDLAFREEAGWIVVDYKTDIEIARAGMARYEAQIAAYAAAIARATGEPAQPVLLRV
jgi:ATP-dependent exoDNAse (exonuclease V) beta subunit